MHRSLQHIDEHYIVKAAARNLPAARLQVDRVPPLLPNNPFRLAAFAAPVPQDLDECAKPNMPVTSSAAAARGWQLISAAYHLGDAPSKSPSRRSPANNAMALSLCGLGCLQTSVSPVRISLRHVALSAAHETSNKVSAHFPNHQHWSCLRRRPIAAPKMPQQVVVVSPADRRRCSDW